MKCNLARAMASARSRHRTPRAYKGQDQWLYNVNRVVAQNPKVTAMVKNSAAGAQAELAMNEPGVTWRPVAHQPRGCGPAEERQHELGRHARRLSAGWLHHGAEHAYQVGNADGAAADWAPPEVMAASTVVSFPCR
jgi:hypothetical protein